MPPTAAAAAGAASAVAAAAEAEEEAAAAAAAARYTLPRLPAPAVAATAALVGPAWGARSPDTAAPTEIEDGCCSAAPAVTPAGFLPRATGTEATAAAAAAPPDDDPVLARRGGDSSVLVITWETMGAMFANAKRELLLLPLLLPESSPTRSEGWAVCATTRSGGERMAALNRGGAPAPAPRCSADVHPLSEALLLTLLLPPSDGAGGGEVAYASTPPPSSPQCPPPLGVAA